MQNKPKFGDHIRVKLDSFFHHGIYLSDNEVIHFCCEGEFTILSRDLKVASTDLNAFSQGNEIEIIIHQKRFTPQKTKEIAISKIGFSDYDLVFNNCEHFANMCIFGKRKSDTMNRLKTAVLKINRNTGINGTICNLSKILEK